MPPAAGSRRWSATTRPSRTPARSSTRSSTAATGTSRLTLDRYRNENAAFRSADGKMLSDHYPIAAGFRWTLNPGLSLSDAFGGPHGDHVHRRRQRCPLGQRATSPPARGHRVDAVGLTLADGTVLDHGGTGGTAHTLTLGAGEHLTSVHAAHGRSTDGRTRIFYARFVTNLGPHPRRRHHDIRRGHLHRARRLADRRLPRPVRRRRRQARRHLHPRPVIRPRLWSARYYRHQTGPPPDVRQNAANRLSVHCGLPSLQRSSVKKKKKKKKIFFFFFFRLKRKMIPDGGT